MNQVVLVGRIAQDLEIKEQGEKKIKIVSVEVQRPFKNYDGKYDKDIIPCILWNGIAESTIEYCKKDDLIAIKGRIQSNEDGIYIVAEKVTFLSSSSGKDDKE